jgi:hypothetical protein
MIALLLRLLWLLPFPVGGRRQLAVERLALCQQFRLLKPIGSAMARIWRRVAASLNRDKVPLTEGTVHGLAIKETETGQRKFPVEYHLFLRGLGLKFKSTSTYVSYLT